MYLVLHQVFDRPLLSHRVALIHNQSYQGYVVLGQGLVVQNWLDMVGEWAGETLMLDVTVYHFQWR